MLRAAPGACMGLRHGFALRAMPLARRCITFRVDCCTLASAVSGGVLSPCCAPLRALAWGYGMVSHFVRCHLRGVYPASRQLAMFVKITMTRTIGFDCDLFVFLTDTPVLVFMSGIFRQLSQKKLFFVN